MSCYYRLSAAICFPNNVHKLLKCFGRLATKRFIPLEMTNMVPVCYGKCSGLYSLKSLRLQLHFSAWHYGYDSLIMPLCGICLLAKYPGKSKIDNLRKFKAIYCNKGANITINANE